MLGDDNGNDNLQFKVNDNKQQKDTLKGKKDEIVSERELNPLLRKNQTDSSVKKSPGPTQSIEWTTVLVKRAIKMIESGEKTFESAAIDRFGSIEAFEDAITQVERYKRTKFNIKIPKTMKVVAETTKTKIYTDGKGTSTPVISKGSVPLSDPAQVDCVNKLMAKKMKAELSGDFEASRKLEEEIYRLHQQPKEKEKLTLLPTETYNKKRAKQDMTISEMVRHEKLSNFKEFDREMERGITGNKKFKDDLDTFDEQVIKEGPSNSSSSNNNNTFDCRSRSIDDYHRREKITKECLFCPDSDRFKLEKGSDWIVAYGNYTYLTVPKTRSIHPLHCLIVPIEHSCSLLDCKEFEEEIWEEVRNFKKCLLHLAAQQDRSYVFIECVMKAEDIRRHTFIDCIPTPRGQYSEHVRGHFLKALQESDSEWSQHNKVIDTSTKSGGLRSALPRKHFPYFYVDFRLDQGYAHVIEDSKQFGNGDFGRDIMASLLGVSRNDWRMTRTSACEFKKFNDSFKPFDWTIKQQ